MSSHLKSQTPSHRIHAYARRKFIVLDFNFVTPLPILIKFNKNNIYQSKSYLHPGYNSEREDISKNHCYFQAIVSYFEDPWIHSPKTVYYFVLE